MGQGIDNQQLAWPDHQAVAHLPGSLPMGGVVPMTPVHAFVQTPDLLRWPSQTDLQPKRHDIDLGGLLAFVIEDVVTDRSWLPANAWVTAKKPPASPRRQACA
jgi:hypothetical protein